MGREEYLKKLMEEIKDFQEEDREQIREYFEEMICDRMEDGETEEEILQAIGSPEQAGIKLRSEYESRPDSGFQTDSDMQDEEQEAEYTDNRERYTDRGPEMGRQFSEKIMQASESAMQMLEKIIQVPEKIFSDMEEKYRRQDTASRYGRQEETYRHSQQEGQNRQDKMQEQAAQNETTGQSPKAGTPEQVTQEGTSGQSPQDGTPKQATQEGTSGQSPQAGMPEQTMQEGTPGQSPQDGIPKQATQEGTSGQSPQAGMPEQAAQEGTSGQNVQDGSLEQGSQGGASVQNSQSGMPQQIDDGMAQQSRQDAVNDPVLQEEKTEPVPQDEIVRNEREAAADNTQDTTDDAPQFIRVQAENTKIHVRTVKRKTVQVLFQPRDGVDEVWTSEEDGGFTFYHRMRKFWFFDVWEFGRSKWITVEIPENYRGRVELVTKNAVIQAENLSGLELLHAETSNARINAARVDAECIWLQTSNSSVSVSEAAGQDLWVKSSNGHISLDDTKFTGMIDVKTSNAAIEVTGVSGSSISLQTSNGAVRGWLPGSIADYDIESRTSNASSTLPTNMHTGKNRKLKVRTSNGKINLSFADNS